MTDHAHAGAANNNTTAEQQQLPSISNQEQTTRLVPIADATRKASSSKKNDREEDNDYLDTILQESIDAVNSRTCSYGGHAVRYQQVQQEMALSSDEDSKNDSTSSERVRVREVDALQQFQHEMVSSDEKIENDSTCTSSVHLDAIQQASGHKRKRRAPNQSFDERLNDLMAFKVKYGHCDVSQHGENSSLGTWCSDLRKSYKKIQNNQKPKAKLSDGQIQRLNDAGFKWSLVKANSGFDEWFNDLMAFKAKYGHCNVSQRGENASLGTWCSQLRASYKKIQANQKPKTKLSDGQIQRLSDAGFKWSIRKANSGFDERFIDLMSFKAKYGHYNVSIRGENASLGQWCSQLRVSYKKIHNNQKPSIKLSDEQIQRLSDAGFKWCR